MFRHVYIPITAINCSLPDKYRRLASPPRPTFSLLAVLSFPVMFGKQWINVVQLVKASKWLAEGDREERRKQGLPRRKKLQ